MIDLDNYTAPAYECGDCRAKHTAYTEAIDVRAGSFSRMGELAKKIGYEGLIGICSDKNTHTIAAEISDTLVKAGFRTADFTLPETPCRADAEKLADERDDARLLLAVGGGSVANAVKYAARLRENSWIYAMTCPSTDSALFDYCEFFENGLRETIHCRPPVAVAADEIVVCSAPKNTAAAGYGTIFSKLLVLFDCNRRRLTGMPVCSTAAGLLKETLDAFFGGGSCERPEIGITRALIRLGLIQQLTQITDFTQRDEYMTAFYAARRAKTPRLIGENLMLASLAVKCIYQNHLAHAKGNLWVPCGVADRLRFLGRECGANMLSMLGTFRYDKDNSAKLFVTEEYSEELLRLLGEIFGSQKARIKAFRRMYPDVGFWLGRYMTPEELLETASAGAVTLSEDSMLRNIVTSGILDEFFAAG